jgi:hypothetical protein
MAATPHQFPSEGLGAGDAVGASLRVVESAVELARAEAKLAAARARSLFMSGLVAGLGVLMAISFVELTLVLIALSPLFLDSQAPWPPAPRPLLLTLAISIGLGLCGAVVAWAAWRRIKAPEDNDATADSGEP